MNKNEAINKINNIIYNDVLLLEWEQEYLANKINDIVNDLFFDTTSKCIRLTNDEIEKYG